MHLQTTTRAHETAAALVLTALGPTTEPHHAVGALQRLRAEVGRGTIDLGDMADRIRGCPSFGPIKDGPPAFAGMPLKERRAWFDALLLSGKLFVQDRHALSNARLRALSASGPKPADLRAIQPLVDRAWHAGVRP